LIVDGVVIQFGEVLVLKQQWKKWLEASRESIRAFHRITPEKPGLPLADLRRQLESLNEALFKELVAALERKDHVRSGANIRRTDHVPTLPPQLDHAGQRLRRLLTEKPLEPPARKELAMDRQSETALRFLVEAGEAVELGPELVLSRPAFDRAVNSIVRHLEQVGEATVSELRPVVGTTRRILIPLLEHLDARRVTVRHGDKRRRGGGSAT
jgi:selenocysteine-specific elongation factor